MSAVLSALGFYDEGRREVTEYDKVLPDISIWMLKRKLAEEVAVIAEQELSEKSLQQVRGRISMLQEIINESNEAKTATSSES